MGYEYATATTFRDTVRREREHRGWTQSRLAQEMTTRGVSTAWPAINKIENGNRNVTISEAAVIAEAFGVTVTRLIGGRSRPKADRDFALRRLHEAVGDGQRAVRTSVRDISTSLTELGEFTDADNTLKDLIGNIQTSIDRLDKAVTELAQVGGKIAEARGRRAILHAEEL